jgi:hypothetical protein
VGDSPSIDFFSGGFGLTRSIRHSRSSDTTPDWTSIFYSFRSPFSMVSSPCSPLSVSSPFKAIKLDYQYLKISSRLKKSHELNERM